MKKKFWTKKIHSYKLTQNLKSPVESGLKFSWNEHSETWDRVSSRKVKQVISEQVRRSLKITSDQRLPKETQNPNKLKVVWVAEGASEFCQISGDSGHWKSLKILSNYLWFRPLKEPQNPTKSEIIQAIKRTLKLNKLEVVRAAKGASKSVLVRATLGALKPHQKCLEIPLH